MAHRSYGLFSNDMQKHMKSLSVLWWQTVRNGHLIMYMFILFNSNDDQIFLMFKQMNSHKFVKRGTRIAGIEAPNRW